MEHTPAFAPARVSARHDGWTADRQRRFIALLADRGCVAEVCRELGISPGSAFRLRRKPGAEAFSQAWDQALTLATDRLTAMAFNRAIYGSVTETWVKGEKVRVQRAQSDRLLMFLLRHHDPRRYGNLAGPLPFAVPDHRGDAAQALPALLDSLTDDDEEVTPDVSYLDDEEEIPQP